MPHVRKISYSSSSFQVAIPKPLAREAGITRGCYVHVTLTKDRAIQIKRIPLNVPTQGDPNATQEEAASTDE